IFIFYKFILIRVLVASYIKRNGVGLFLNFIFVNLKTTIYFKSNIMKLITLLSVLFLFNSCGNNKKVVLTTHKEVILLADGLEEKDGDVSVVISNHSNLNLKDDTIGAIYPVIASGNDIVINFKYEEKSPEGTADGDYSETLHFEIPQNTTVLNLMDEELNNVKLLYGKECFCRGEAGYYKIKKGKIKIMKTESEIYFDIIFSIDETATKLVRVAQNIKL
ncbi:hypothetical protein N9562_00250, partial [Flavobacteriaceae bacterium]|nr:hypothetical protein [Flavobacteriaceae bacterium]